MTNLELEQLKFEIRELTALCVQVEGKDDPRSQWLHQLVLSNIALRHARLAAMQARVAIQAPPRRQAGGARQARLSGALPAWLAGVRTTISEFSYRKRGTL